MHGPVFCMAHVSNWRTAQCRKRIGMRTKKSLLAWVTNPSNTSHHCTYTAAATNDASLAEICIMYLPSIRQVPSLGMVDSAVAIAQWFLACLQCVNCVSLSDNMNAIKIILRRSELSYVAAAIALDWKGATALKCSILFVIMPSCKLAAATTLIIKYSSNRFDFNLWGWLLWKI